MVVHFLRAMVDLSSDLTTKTAAEMQWYTLNSSKEAKKLAFNPSLYAKNRVNLSEFHIAVSGFESLHLGNLAECLCWLER